MSITDRLLKSGDKKRVATFLKIYRAITENNLLALGVLPFFLLIPGFLDEAVGVGALLALGIIAISMRKDLIQNRKRIEEFILETDSNDLPMDAKKAALADLNAVSMPR